MRHFNNGDCTHITSSTYSMSSRRSRSGCGRRKRIRINLVPRIRTSFRPQHGRLQAHYKLHLFYLKQAEQTRLGQKKNDKDQLSAKDKYQLQTSVACNFTRYRDDICFSKSASAWGKCFAV
jgi:hypothetical protein